VEIMPALVVNPVTGCQWANFTADYADLAARSADLSKIWKLRDGGPFARFFSCSRPGIGYIPGHQKALLRPCQIPNGDGSVFFLREIQAAERVRRTAGAALMRVAIASRSSSSISQLRPSSLLSAGINPDTMFRWNFW
jgi:hypothetical protein